VADLSVLFRYRDLVAPTLDRHRAIIKSAGHCWWGWWKRPSEDARLDIWDHLEAKLKGGKKLTIALFHSGNGQIHLADVAKVVRPVDELASRPPELKTTELKFVPEYYRESIFSRAWLKLTKIDASPLKEADFYKTYAYDDPPPLPRLLPEDLERLRNKQIVDFDELRAMDATIWRIKRSDTSSGSAHFLAPTGRERRPVSAAPLSVKGTKILHLSDIHFDERTGAKSQHSWSRPGRKPIEDMVSQALKKHVGDIGMLIVSGDITFMGSSAEFDRAHKSIYQIMGALDLGPEHVIVCPGNHDIVWSKRKRESFDPNKEITPTVAPETAKKNYAEFYKKLLLHSPNDDLSMGRRYVLPHGLVLEICALNSTSLAAGHKYLAGMGCVGPAAFQTVRSDLGWHDLETSTALRAVVLHHHLVSTDDVEPAKEYYTGFGMAIDAQKTMREAARVGVALAIHGHRHRPFYWQSSVYELPQHAHDQWAYGDVSIIGGGSAGSTEVDDANFFNVIDLKPRSVTSTMYRSKDGAPFTTNKTWQADIVSGPIGLSLSRWRILEPEKK